MPSFPAAGNPPGADAPHVPTAAQLALLQTLQGNVASAISIFHSIRAGTNSQTISYKQAHANVLNAYYALAQYQAYLGGGNKPGIYDEGSSDVT
jgi:hypothetical protein